MVRIGPIALGILVSLLTAVGVVGAMWVVIAFEVGLHGGRPGGVVEAGTAAVVGLGLAAGLVAWAAAARAAPAPAPGEPRPPSS